MRSLLDKLCFNCADIFGLVLEHVKSLKRNKLTLLDPEESLAKVNGIKAITEKFFHRIKN